MLVRASVGVSQTAVYALMVVVVIAMCPVIMFAANGLSTDIQLYTVTLVEKTRELNMEKFKTETLLYQMVPRSVADRLKSCGSVSHMNLHSFTKYTNDIQPILHRSIPNKPFLRG